MLAQSNSLKFSPNQHNQQIRQLNSRKSVLSEPPLQVPHQPPHQSLRQLLQAPGPWLLLQNLAHGSVFPRV